MKSYSLSTLLLLVLIAALSVAQFVMMRQLSDARAEVENVRRKYGYIRVDDKKKTYVSRIARNGEAQTSYRIVVPAGSRYLLHLTDTVFEGSDYPEDPIPTKTISSLNGWREGADVVLSYSIFSENNAPRVVVHTEANWFFNYVPPDWVSGTGQSEGLYLQPDPQAAFSIDDTIRFMWWRNSTTKRGIMLWLEPFTKLEARQAAKESNK